MARQNKNNTNKGGEIGVLLLGACSGVYSWITGNREIVLMIALAVVALIALLFFAKIVRARKYWAWYFSRERGLQELGTQDLLLEETDAALSKSLQKVKDCLDSYYISLSNACEDAYESDEITWLEGDSEKYSGKSPFSGEELANSINLQADGKIATFYCKTDEDGGYTFLLLPNAIYAFITGEGSKTSTFIGAYEKTTLNLSFDHKYVQKTYTHITDMAHEPREYFLKYCDIGDRRPVAAGWQYETKNGYRDGRRQGNNYFIIRFIYFRVDFAFGSMKSSAAFSYVDSEDDMKNSFKSYRKAKYKPPIANIVKEDPDEDIMAKVTAGKATE